MISFREQLAENDNEIKALDKWYEDFKIKRPLLRNQKDKLIYQVIEEENILADTNWTISVAAVGFGVNAFLYYDGDHLDLYSKITHEVLKLHQHVNFYFPNDISLSFQSNATLTFKNTKTYFHFVNKHKLIVNGTVYRDQIKLLQNQINFLEKCHHIYNIK